MENILLDENKTNIKIVGRKYTSQFTFSFSYKPLRNKPLYWLDWRPKHNKHSFLSVIVKCKEYTLLRMNILYVCICRLQVFVRSFKVSWNSNNALCNVICFFICLQQLTTFLVDFGLSNICRGDDLLKTQCGSPEYAAPELFKRGCRYGTEVDLWSLWVNDRLFCLRSKLIPIC